MKIIINLILMLSIASNCLAETKINLLTLKDGKFGFTRVLSFNGQGVKIHNKNHDVIDYELDIDVRKALANNVLVHSDHLKQSVFDWTTINNETLTPKVFNAVNPRRPVVLYYKNGKFTAKQFHQGEVDLDSCYNKSECVVFYDISTFSYYFTTFSGYEILDFDYVDTPGMTNSKVKSHPNK